MANTLSHQPCALLLCAGDMGHMGGMGGMDPAQLQHMLQKCVVHTLAVTMCHPRHPVLACHTYVPCMCDT